MLTFILPLVSFHVDMDKINELMVEKYHKNSPQKIEEIIPTTNKEKTLTLK